MRSERVEIAGFFHFPQPCVLDLADLGPGVHAIVGINGHGKTRLLDAGYGSIYGPGNAKAFPSRDGTLASYATSRDAYIDGIWANRDRRYHTRINVDSQSRKVEASIEELLGVGKKKLLNDGGVKTFKEVISNLFLSPQTVLASAFAAQNRRGSFGQLDQIERMQLFVELADLAHLESMSKWSKASANEAADIIETARAVLIEMRRSSADLDALVARLSTLAREQEEAETDLLVAQGLEADAIREVESLQGEAVEYARLKAASEAAHAVLEQVRRDLIIVETSKKTAATNKVEKIAASVSRRDAAKKRIDTRRATSATAFEKAQADRTERIANNKIIIGKADEIQIAVTETEIANGILERLAGRRSEVAPTLKSLQAAATAASEALRDSTSAKKTRLESERQIGILKVVKFGDRCAEDPPCRFVSDAAKAKESLPGLVTLSDAAPEREAAAKIASEAVAAVERDLEAIDKDEREARQTIQKHKENVALVGDLRTAEARIKDLTTAIEDARTQQFDAMIALDQESLDAERTAEDEGETIVADYVKLVAEQDAKMSELTTAYATALLNSETAKQAAEAKADAQSRLDAATAARTSASAKVVASSASVARISKEREGLQADVDRRTAASARVITFETSLTRAEAKQASWALIAKALGRDGIQRLEIDAAGPVVSDLANQLLEVGYGPRFGIQIVTQIATADKKEMKEKFTIEATDNNNGSEPRDLSDLSPGEAVMVNEALRAALSCYVNISGRYQCETIWRDETTGALSPGNIPPYVAMLRKLLVLSRAYQVIFVTQSTDAADLADSVVEVKNGSARVVRRAA